MKQILQALLIITILLNCSISSEAQKYAKAKDLKGLAVGQLAPKFSAKQANGILFSLDEALKKGPVVMVFYRGEWCPICNRHLSNLQDSAQLIMDKGATLIAVSPQKPEYLEEMKSKTGAEFTLLYDEGFKISDAYKSTFRPSFFYRLIYNSMGAKLKSSQSDDSQQLPVPATYVIATDGTIIWRHFDPDYSKRSTAAEILKALE